MIIRGRMQEIMEDYPYNFSIFAIEDVFNIDDLSSAPELTVDDERTQKLNDIISDVSTLTSKEDILSSMKRNLLIAAANYLEIPKIATGETASDMAIKLISSTSKGRGINLRNELSYVEDLQDFGDINVQFIRPLKEFLAEEIAYYYYINKVKTVSLPTINSTIKRAQYRSLNLLCEGFISKLQSEFPHTVHTIVRAGSKLKPTRDHQLRYCALCTSLLEANDTDLCYGCKIIYEESKNENKEIFQITNKLTNKDAILQEIQDSLL
eukprot:TRINITY_DN3180_c0_g2_i3.p1 TRINITY_DN3180_c0_g2~~TRINITY_DN3180_c0_g2_i3.p1  ORF type:complete len:266 (+),score=57.14 TRINITY_DN3180_c0_g2_i3:166-963(+)